MAKTSKVNKNEQRKALVAKYATRRREIKEHHQEPRDRASKSASLLS